MARRKNKLNLYDSLELGDMLIMQHKDRTNFFQEQLIFIEFREVHSLYKASTSSDPQDTKDQYPFFWDSLNNGITRISRKMIGDITRNPWQNGIREYHKCDGTIWRAKTNHRWVLHKEGK